MADTEGQVVEQSGEGVESSTPAPEATTPTTSEDVWESPIFTEASEDTVEKESVSETPPTPESGAPEGEAPEEDKEPEPAETEPEEDESPEVDLSTIDPDRPARLSRKRREEVIKEVIEPFRDPKVPAEEVFEALYKLNPERAEALAMKVAEYSAQNHPDEWLSVILGEKTSVQDIKAKLAGTTDQAQQETDAFAPVIEALTEVYGEEWRDPANDSQILDEDRAYVEAVRTHLAEQSIRAQNDALKDKQIEALRNELQGLKPEIEQIKTEQQAKFEREVDEAYQSSVKEYQTEIESKSLEKLFSETGLNASESDTAEVKALKELIRTRFDRDQSGDFDRFVATAYSDSEKLMKAVDRVDKHLSAAAKAELSAKTERDRIQAERLAVEAQAHRREAKAEQDALRVLHRNAAKEFLTKKLSPMLDVLKENADLKQRLSRTRPEILGSTSTGVPDLKQRIADAEDPWGREGWDVLSVSR